MKNKKLKQLNTPQSRRRGIAIEMAMLFMLVVVALSALAVSLAMMQNERRERTHDTMELRMVLEQMGGDFCLLRESCGIPEELNDDEYSITNTGTFLQVSRVPEGEGEALVPILTVELTLIDGTYTVTKWSYGE